jgi:5-methyltetrahydropteroyltriglutamate--homocysteine methyltransferase
MAFAMKPPFRADQVGSLLRPAALASARLQFKQGALSGIALRKVEDDCIRAVVEKQESIGLRSITDGELRREYWHIDFLRQLDGVTIAAMPNQNRFGGTEEQPPVATVSGKVGCSRPIMVDAFAYLRGITGGISQSIKSSTPKVTIAVPARRPQCRIEHGLSGSGGILARRSHRLSARDTIFCGTRLHLPAAG